MKAISRLIEVDAVSKEGSQIRFHVPAIVLGNKLAIINRQDYEKSATTSGYYVEDSSKWAWNITHLPSGKYVTKHLKSFKEAKSLAEVFLQKFPPSLEAWDHLNDDQSKCEDLLKFIKSKISWI